MNKKVKTLKSFGVVMMALAILTIIAGIAAAIILPNWWFFIGSIIGAIPLFASYAAINVICYTAETVREIKQGILPTEPAAPSKPAAVTPAPALGTYERVTGALRNGCTFEIDTDGVTITYSDGNTGSLTNNINGVYILQYQGRTFEYQTPHDAAEALYYTLAGK